MTAANFTSRHADTRLVSYQGRSYVRNGEDAEWYGPSAKVYSSEDLAVHGWVPVEHAAPVVTKAAAVKFTLVLLRHDPEQHPIVDVCNLCGAMVGDTGAHRTWHEDKQ
jgi:hypothetical protein